MHASVDEHSGTGTTLQAGDATETTLDALWAAAQGSGWPARGLDSLLEEAERLAHQLRPADRLAWLSRLHDTWKRHHWGFSTQGKFHLLRLAAHWSDWALVAAVGEDLSRQAPLPGHESQLLMEALRNQGRAEAAIALAVSRQLAHPEEGWPHRVRESLLRWCALRDRLGWIDGCTWGDDELLLEPLGHHHLPDFAWQYHDPAIAERCCLPSFGSDQQWHCWLKDSQRFGDQWTGAVIHREWGFIGSVSLILHGGLGFFYYWFGPDFQGQGFGPRAVGLLLAAAQERYGLHTCYAKVFDDNLPSRRALEKLGFEDIGVSAIAPDDKEIFYRRGAAVERRRMAEELHWLMGAMASGTRPAILLRANP